ncbi:uncharacterized protein IUM83_10540 [Phytophthora cinnamomi]|uniref:uncharacterized protein n=1 Tax=Phytophthora cinnamomi TaxID=4785 RepID=UPI00355A9C3F|nr:hypothetical protein IUM83_10540 [Phytophthora cinnamomi]
MEGGSTSGNPSWPELNLKMERGRADCEVELGEVAAEPEEVPGAGWTRGVDGEDGERSWKYLASSAADTKGLASRKRGPTVTPLSGSRIVELLTTEAILAGAELCETCKKKRRSRVFDPTHSPSSRSAEGTGAELGLGGTASGSASETPEGAESAAARAGEFALEAGATLAAGAGCKVEQLQHHAKPQLSEEGSQTQEQSQGGRRLDDEPSQRH